MSLTAMCNINMLYFLIVVLVCIFVADDFRSGYAKNLFTVRAKKTDYVISKTVVGFVGAAAMLACVLFLPAVCGAYAYLIGLFASFSVNTVCNLVLLGKKCGGLFQGLWTQNGKKIVVALVLVLPLCLFGELLCALSQKLFGEFLTTLVSAFALGIVVFIAYLAFGILPWERLFGKRKKTRK